MNRIKLPSINKLIFSTNLQVRIYDLNYGNHLGNDSLISLIHEARVRFFKSYNFKELDIGGIGILITNLAVNYKAEAFYGDEIIVDIGISDISKTSVEFLYALKLQNTGNEIAKAITIATFFDYKISKVVKVPQAFLDAIQDFIVADNIK
jgi:acyl-CoA thioester hydrolase